MFNFVGTKRFHICYLRFEVVKSPAIDKFPVSYFIDQ